MATTVTVAVSTLDAAPVQAPYRVSLKTGRDQATAALTAKLADGSQATVKALIVEEGGSGIGTGRRLSSRTSVCSPKFKCGTGRPCSTWTMPAGYSVGIPASALSGGADGTRTVNVYTLTRGEGWT